jgi:hypothetical protein
MPKVRLCADCSSQTPGGQPYCARCKEARVSALLLHLRRPNLGPFDGNNPDTNSAPIRWMVMPARPSFWPSSN